MTKSKLKNPKTRIKYAWGLLILSVIGMFLNVSLYLFKIIDENMLILITLILSWLAITLTALDVVLTADVRAQEEKKEK